MVAIFVVAIALPIALAAQSIVVHSSDAVEMFRGFLIGWVTSALLAVLLLMVLPALPTYRARVLFFAIAGLTLSVFVNGGATVWWHHTPGWALLNGVYNAIAWTIAGLVLAWFIRPGIRLDEAQSR